MHSDLDQLLEKDTYVWLLGLAHVSSCRVKISGDDLHVLLVMDRVAERAYYSHSIPRYYRTPVSQFVSLVKEISLYLPSLGQMINSR